MATKFKRVIPDNVNVIGLKSGDIKPLQIACGSTQCNNNLHCFSRYMKSAERKFGKKGACYNCGEASIDWGRVHQNNIDDAKYIFDSLNKELMRKIFSTIQIEQTAIDNVKSKTRLEVRAHAQRELKSKVGKYNSFIDGKQTHLGGDDIVHYAQHATGTCCRKCIQAWHNIPMKQDLTEAQLEFCTDLVMLYIDEKLPNAMAEENLNKN